MIDDNIFRFHKGHMMRHHKNNHFSDPSGGGLVMGLDCDQVKSGLSEKGAPYSNDMLRHHFCKHESLPFAKKFKVEELKRRLPGSDFQ